MDLEQRVQALEQEVEILKSQIQATLLDIQEQILTNAYPSLRSGSVPGKNSAGEAEQVDSMPVKIFRPPSDGDGSGPNQNTIPANVRRVSVNSLEDTGFEAELEPTENLLEPTATSQNHANTVSWSTIDELEEWVSSKVEKVGADRTRELIFMYLEKGRFTPDIVDTLLQFVDLYEGDVSRPFELEEATRPSAPPRLPAKPTQPARPRSSPAAKRKSTESRSRGKASSTPPRDSVPGRGPSPAQKNKPPEVPETPPPRGSNSTGRPVPQHADDEGERGTVLRLIAGIYNAGAGVKWSKKDG